MTHEMNDPMASKRHRWEPTDDHFYPGPKPWRCIKCGLQKITEYEEKPTYRWHDGRTSKRFAPPCPPNRNRVGPATINRIDWGREK
jgi:hypothetical protein